MQPAIAKMLEGGRGRGSSGWGMVQGGSSRAQMGRYVQLRTPVSSQVPVDLPPGRPWISSTLPYVKCVL